MSTPNCSPRAAIGPVLRGVIIEHQPIRTGGNQHVQVPLVERFRRKVDKNGPIPAHCPELGPCHLWTGTRHYRGYGKFRIGNRMVPAHRVAWELENGPMPPGMDGCHHCDNPPCVRASHIYPGTKKNNAGDMMQRGRWVRLSRAGERNGRAKLNRQQVEAIRRDAGLPGATPRLLAASYGVAPSTISDILAGRRWP